ncbi:hypothetical protein BC940DRAFT_296303 [Gongronella butleri]|nr:hypothetical protein BC940DRAFT_296303 [Gongronella butleri]
MDKKREGGQNIGWSCALFSRSPNRPKVRIGQHGYTGPVRVSRHFLASSRAMINGLPIPLLC